MIRMKVIVSFFYVMRLFFCKYADIILRKVKDDFIQYIYIQGGMNYE